MKIAVAQTRPIKGDIKGNTGNHLAFVQLAASRGAEMIVFPELSLTGYEPALAKELATTLHDSRFDVFQELSDTSQITIGAGIPLLNGTGVSISMVLFQPNKTRQLYAKQYLHADEEPFFTSGQSSVCFSGDKSNIALAICYELSVPEHVENAVSSGAAIYIASVAKSVGGIDKALTRLSDIAAKNSMTVLMSNCIGYCDDFECAGKTSVWNNKGMLAAQLNDTDEGILIIDTATQEMVSVPG